MVSGNPSKAVTGTGLGLEFDNIATMSATKVDTSSAATLLSLNVTGSTIPTNGIYSPAANQIGFATASINRATLVLGMLLGAPAGGDQGAGTLNATGLFVNGVSLGTGAANPAASLGLAAVNGVATTFMRSDGAPALSQAIIPTWTGTHTFSGNTLAHVIAGKLTIGTPSSGVPLTVNGLSGAGGLGIHTAASNANATLDISNTSTGTSGNTQVRVFNSTDAAILGIRSTGFTGAAGFTNGPAGEAVDFGTAANIPISIGTNVIERIRVAAAGNVTINAPASGTALTANGIAAGPTQTLQANGTNIFQVGGTSSPVVQCYGPTAAALVDMTPDKGTFTLTFTGGTTAPTVTATWARIGNLVTLYLPFSNTTMTSNATTFTATGLPAAIQPATLTQIITTYGSADNATTNVAVFEDNTVRIGGTITVTAASGTLTFGVPNGFAINNSGWTASGTKGISNPVQFSYLLI